MSNYQIKYYPVPINCSFQSNVFKYGNLFYFQTIINKIFYALYKLF